jgi:hypothetical protein
MGSILDSPAVPPQRAQHHFVEVGGQIIPLRLVPS